MGAVRRLYDLSDLAVRAGSTKMLHRIPLLERLIIVSQPLSRPLKAGRLQN